MARRMLNVLIILVTLYVALMLLVVWREKSFIYIPSRQIEATPERYEDVWLTTSDGVRINGWFVPAATNSALTVLLCHGNAGNISHRLEKLAILHDIGANVFLLDYRGYGRSEGSPDERGTYLDAQAAYDYLAGKNVVIYGESLGAAVAVELATKNRVAGVIIEEPFSSAVDVGKKMFPYLPVQWLARNRYETIRKIDRIETPLLILHSREDEFFDYRHAERLFAAAREPKRLVELRGSHNDAFLVSGETYRLALAQFLRSL